jgi:hypothetical protein
MKYGIDRASYFSTTQPCDEAYLVKGSKTDWRINITSLKQLRDFVEREGKIVLSEGHIIIYDTWIE